MAMPHGETLVSLPVELKTAEAPSPQTTSDTDKKPNHLRLIQGGLGQVAAFYDIYAPDVMAQETGWFTVAEHGPITNFAAIADMAPNDDESMLMCELHGPITFEEAEQLRIEKLQAESTTYVRMEHATPFSDDASNGQILVGRTSAQYKIDPPAPQPPKPFEYY
jgi:hypothetical protein